MNKQDLTSKLSTLPGEIETQEQAVISAYEQVQESKSILTEAEDVLQLSGTIDGKNAEIRQAQLRAKTAGEREGLQKAESNLSREKAKLNLLINELTAYRAIAAMLKAGE
jgi:hypothetical protein